MGTLTLPALGAMPLCTPRLDFVMVLGTLSWAGEVLPDRGTTAGAGPGFQPIPRRPGPIWAYDGVLLILSVRITDLTAGAR
jgi:hypothetical protein